MPHHMNHSYGINIAWVYYLCITNSSLKNKMKCLFSCVHTLGFSSNIQAKDQSKVDMILNTSRQPQESRKSYYQESSKELHNCKTIGPQEPQQSKLGFLIDWGLQKEIFIWEWANTPKHDSICSKEPQGSIHKFTVCPRECIPKNKKLGFHSVNFICCTKGKIGIFANIKWHDL